MKRLWYLIDWCAKISNSAKVGNFQIGAKLYFKGSAWFKTSFKIKTITFLNKIYTNLLWYSLILVFQIFKIEQNKGYAYPIFGRTNSAASKPILIFLEINFLANYFCTFFYKKRKIWINIGFFRAVESELAAGWDFPGSRIPGFSN